MGVIGWSVRAAGSGRVLSEQLPDRVFRTASVGKLLLLIEVADRLRSGRWTRGTMLHRTPADSVADSGLWQHLQTDRLPVADLAVLVGAVSDNLATNVLLREIGLPAVLAVAQRLGLQHTRLHDRVRDQRGPADPPTLSSGTAAELTRLFALLHQGAVIDSGVSATVLDWLSNDTDTSMAATAFGVDPLAHRDADRGLRLAHKTGTDTGVRADTGLLAGPAAIISYAVLAEFDDADRDEVLAAMAEVGRRIATLAGGRVTDRG